MSTNPVTLASFFRTSTVTDDRKSDIPAFKVGDHATAILWSDRNAGFITRVSADGKRVWFAEGEATLLNGVNSGADDALQFAPGGFVGHTSGQQRWEIKPAATPHEVEYSLRNNGRWVRKGEPASNGQGLRAGHSHHYDFNF